MKARGDGRYAGYVKRARALGAKDAKPIRAQSVATAPWVRLKCQFGCDGYGETLTCPPHSPTPEQTKEMLSHYKTALLIHGDESTDIHKIVAKLEREIFLDGFHKAFGMGAGPCHLCPECADSCRYPEQARPAMEACGIDVYRTVRANGFPIEVARNRRCKPDYYGLVLID